MQQRFWVLWALVALLAMSGCSREESADESVNEPGSESRGESVTTGGGVPEDNVFSDQVKALEKAKGVEQTLDDAAAKQRETLEQQEQR